MAPLFFMFFFLFFLVLVVGVNAVVVFDDYVKTFDVDGAADVVVVCLFVCMYVCLLVWFG